MITLNVDNLKCYKCGTKAQVGDRMTAIYTIVVRSQELHQFRRDVESHTEFDLSRWYCSKCQPYSELVESLT